MLSHSILYSQFFVKAFFGSVPSFRNLVKGYPPAFIVDFALRKGNFLSSKFRFRHCETIPMKNQFFLKVFFIPVLGDVVSESYAYPLGYFLALTK